MTILVTMKLFSVVLVVLVSIRCITTTASFNFEALVSNKPSTTSNRTLRITKVRQRRHQPHQRHVFQYHQHPHQQNIRLLSRPTITLVLGSTTDPSLQERFDNTGRQDQEEDVTTIDAKDVDEEDDLTNINTTAVIQLVQNLEADGKNTLINEPSTLFSSTMMNKNGVIVTMKESKTIISTTGATTADQKHHPAVDDPTYKSLLIFAITTVIIWLSEPLLSLVDTTVVGWSQSNAAVVTQLASLGPATTLTDSLLYSTYGLSIATTNRIAAERAIPHNERQLQTTVSHVLGISLVMGSLCTMICWGFARPLLTIMAGGSGTPELLYYATMYTRIRSAVSIAAVGGVTLQSICLAQQNVKTPALAVLAASVTNLAGDIALRQYGVIGAAIATAAASFISAVILFRSVRDQFLFWRAKDAMHETLIPIVSLPDRNAAWKLLKLAGPIFFVIVAKIFCYGAMTLRCTEFGVEALAAQSILMRVFFFFACFGDAFSQTAQSFLPATIYPKPNRPAFGRIFRKLLWLAGIGGLINSQASTFILQRLSGYLTSDLGIIAIMKSHSNFVGMSLFFHAFIMLLEGVVLASRDFTSLIATYSITVAMHFGVLKLLCGSFTGVWKTFVLFQTTRLALYAWRVVKRFQNQEASSVD